VLAAQKYCKSDCGLYYNQDEQLFKDTSHTNETIEQPATSASCTKILLENIDLWGSLALLAHLLVPLPDFLFLAFNKCIENEEVLSWAT